MFGDQPLYDKLDVAKELSLLLMIRWTIEHGKKKEK